MLLYSSQMLLLLVLVSTTAFAKPSFEKQWDDFKERLIDNDNDCFITDGGEGIVIFVKAIL